MNYSPRIAGVEQLMPDPSLACELVQAIYRKNIWSEHEDKSTPWLASLPPVDVHPTAMHHPDHRPFTKVFKQDTGFIVRSFQRGVVNSRYHNQTEVNDFFVCEEFVAHKKLIIPRKNYGVGEPITELYIEEDAAQLFSYIFSNWPVKMYEARKAFNYRYDSEVDQAHDSVERRIKRRGHFLMRRAERKILGQRPK